MALRIVCPDDLDNKSESYLFSALQDLGAEAVTDREWHFKRGIVAPDEFRTKLREKLSGKLSDSEAQALVNRVTIEILRPR